MSDPWFFAAPEHWQQDAVFLPTEESHHALKVLRLAPEGRAAVTDGLGRVAHGLLEVIPNEGACVRVEKIEQRPRMQPQVVVYQATAKGRKVDEIIERVAELGVAELWVYSAERSVAEWDEKKVVRLLARWSAIARSVAKQSRNPWLMLTGTLTWPLMVGSVAREPEALVLWEEATQPLREVLPKNPERVAFVVGPEGGLTSGEAHALAAEGASVVSLGANILRTENAAVAAASSLLWHYGAIG